MKRKAPLKLKCVITAATPARNPAPPQKPAPALKSALKSCLKRSKRTIEIPGIFTNDTAKTVRFSEAISTTRIIPGRPQRYKVTAAEIFANIHPVDECERPSPPPVAAPKNLVADFVGQIVRSAAGKSSTNMNKKVVVKKRKTQLALCPVRSGSGLKQQLAATPPPLQKPTLKIGISPSVTSKKRVGVVVNTSVVTPQRKRKRGLSTAQLATHASFQAGNAPKKRSTGHISDEESSDYTSSPESQSEKHFSAPVSTSQSSPRSDQPAIASLAVVSPAVTPPKCAPILIQSNVPLKRLAKEGHLAAITAISTQAKANQACEYVARNAEKWGRLLLACKEFEELQLQQKKKRAAPVKRKPAQRKRKRDQITPAQNSLNARLVEADQLPVSVRRRLCPGEAHKEPQLEEEDLTCPSQEWFLIRPKQYYVQLSLEDIQWREFQRIRLGADAQSKQARVARGSVGLIDAGTRDAVRMTLFTNAAWIRPRSPLAAPQEENKAEKSSPTPERTQNKNTPLPADNCTLEDVLDFGVLL